jgi:hypothetical protein
MVRDDFLMGHPMSPWYPWKQHRRFLSFEFSLSNKTLAISIEQVRYSQTSPLVTVDGVLDQKPSESPCKRNLPAILLQLNSAQKKRTTPTSSSRRSVLHRAKLIHRYQILQVVVHSSINKSSNSNRFGIARENLMGTCLPKQLHTMGFEWGSFFQFFWIMLLIIWKCDQHPIRIRLKKIFLKISPILIGNTLQHFSQQLCHAA